MQKLAILLLLACAACSTKASDPAASQPPKAAQPAAPATGAASGSDLLAQIQARIGKAGCSTDSQCQILPVGAKACGGPASYLAWSNAQTNGTELQALADRYREQQQASNTRSGMISDCRVVAPPAAACRAGSCQLIDAVSPQ